MTKIQLKRSNVLENGSAKEPLLSQTEYGELCVNYNEADPAIFIRDSSDQIVRLAGAGAVGNIEIPDTGADPHQPGTTDDRYVEVSGDNMTGNLTLGTDKITLDATNGNVSFAQGNFEVSATGFATITKGASIEGVDEGISLLTLRSNHSGAQNFPAFTVRDNNLDNVFEVSATGTTEIYGPGSPSDPKIALKSDGSAEFVGGDISLNADGSAGFTSYLNGGTGAIDGNAIGYGLLAFSNSASTGGGGVNQNSSVYARNYVGTGRNYIGINGSGATTFEVFADGSGTFNKSLQVGGDYTSVFLQENGPAGQVFCNFDTAEANIDQTPSSTSALKVTAWTNGASTENIDFKYDGSATFAGDVNTSSNFIAGGNPNGGASEGSRLDGGGKINVSRSNGSTNLFEGYTTGNSSATSSITAGGSATFNGNVNIKSALVLGDFGVSGFVGGIYDRGLTSDVYNVYPVADQANTSIALKRDGSAKFAGGVIIGTETSSQASAIKRQGHGQVVFHASAFGVPVSTVPFAVYNTSDDVSSIAPTSYILGDGSATFDGNITAGNVTFNTGADDPANYTTTTEEYEEQEELTPYIPAVEAVYGEPPLITPAVDPVVGPLGNVLVEGTEAVYGEAPLISEAVPAVEATYQTVTKTREIRTYTGPTLDVKERLQNVLSRIDAIEANEVADDATDSALLQLVASLTARLDEKDAAIASLTATLTALTDRVTTLES